MSYLVKNPHRLWRTIDHWLLGDNRDSEYAISGVIFVAEVIERVYGRRSEILKEAGLAFRDLLEQVRTRSIAVDGELVMLIWNWRYKVEESVSELQLQGELTASTIESLQYQIFQIRKRCEQKAQVNAMIE